MVVFFLLLPGHMKVWYSRLKIAKDTFAVASRESWHEAIDLVNVLKALDPLSQKHQNISTVKMFDHLEEQRTNTQKKTGSTLGSVSY